MGELRPLKEARRVVLEFTYEVDRAWVDQMIDEEGYEPSSSWRVDFDLSEISPSGLRKRLRHSHDRYEAVEEGYPVLSTPTQDPLEFADGIEEWLNATEKERAAAATKAEAEMAGEIANNEAFEREMGEWVAAHGSARLRAAVKRRYKANRTYALERAAAEFPHFWVDTSEDLEWHDRIDPTAAALELEAQIGALLERLEIGEAEARIVWLTEAPREVDQVLDEIGEQFEPQEAIVVSPYLRRYQLAIPVDPAQHVKLESSE